MRPIIAFLAAAASFGSIAITASPSQAEKYMCIKNGGAYILKAELHGTKGTSSENLIALTLTLSVLRLVPNLN